jgi:DNA-binding NtrC family response regulator
MKVLFADDDPDVSYFLRTALIDGGHDVLQAQNGVEAFELAKSGAPEVIILDVNMPQLDGLSLTKRLKADLQLRYVPVILLTSNRTSEDIVAGLAAGANDYLIKPASKIEILARIHAAHRTKEIYTELAETHSQNELLKEQLSGGAFSSTIIGNAPTFKRVLELLPKVALAKAPVLLRGESGTGKELVARRIHDLSPRQIKGAFVAQNCAALAESLLESTLFGHVKGAFTGAIKDHVGLFAVANGGTLFLDEVGEMSGSLQAKLLRVLQEGVFTPIGSVQEKRVDVRVIAATHRPLEDMIKRREFREDLYYRLNVVPITLPPLRERIEDIESLVNFFYERKIKELGFSRKPINKSILDLFRAYPWPGNIRQLQNEIERILILSSEGGLLDPNLVADEILGFQERVSKEFLEVLVTEEEKGSMPLRSALQQVERKLISECLEKFEQNRSRVARELGISRSNLIAKIESYGL